MGRLIERRVKKAFRDKGSNYPYLTGSKFSTYSEERINELVQKGYLEGDKVTPSVPKEDKGMDAETMTIAELKQVAKEQGVEVEGTGKNGAVKKEDLIEALAE